MFIRYRFRGNELICCLLYTFAARSIVYIVEMLRRSCQHDHRDLYGNRRACSSAIVVPPKISVNLNLVVAIPYSKSDFQ